MTNFIRRPSRHSALTDQPDPPSRRSGASLAVFAEPEHAIEGRNESARQRLDAEIDAMSTGAEHRLFFEGRK